MVRVHHHYAVRGGRIAFADLHAAVAKILRISRLDTFFDLYPTVQAAVRGHQPETEHGELGCFGREAARPQAVKKDAVATKLLTTGGRIRIRVTGKDSRSLPVPARDSRARAT